MDYEANDVITLNNNEKYAIVSMKTIEETEYLYLASIDDPLKLKLLKREAGEEGAIFKTVTDKKEFEKTLKKIL